jgi:hypothetical protein
MSVIRPWAFCNPNETILDKRNLRSFDPNPTRDQANAEKGSQPWSDAPKALSDGHGVSLSQVDGGLAMRASGHQESEATIALSS